MTVLSPLLWTSHSLVADMRRITGLHLFVALWMFSFPTLIVLGHDSHDLHPEDTQIHSDDIASYDQIQTGCILAPLRIRLHKPYDVQGDQRFTYTNETEIFHFSVRKDDKPFKPSSSTKPRTEARFMDADYSNGLWMIEGQFLVPENVTGACVIQLRAFKSHTLTMVTVRNGNLMHYDKEMIVQGISGNWQHIIIRHDVDAGTVEHFINGTLKMTTSIDLSAQKAAAPFYFKAGVYMQDDASPTIESSWRQFKIWNCTGVDTTQAEFSEDTTNSSKDDNTDNEDDDGAETQDDSGSNGGNKKRKSTKNSDEGEHHHKKHKQDNGTRTVSTDDDSKKKN